jgi:hypothetical protein
VREPTWESREPHDREIEALNRQIHHLLGPLADQWSSDAAGSQTGHSAGHSATKTSARLTHSRWWLPFCLVVDWVVAAILVVLIAAGVDFHH